ncbi:hypothetical protein FISHEDRAFT_43680 [Fistulina hepatica ATCC 64428]|uniref:ARM repeat-containing protein n=1 Tax=Fistulina hepatica ATCC 64428 TaxID=1128425 RepID=A0A0D7AD88_9AGAR|nr:hypothetical protein FISHEDRAFT_43680 [Fistulina hepatica ATCC 64428]
MSQLKAVCVPLMGSSALTPTSIPVVSKLLDDLLRILQSLLSESVYLKSSMLSYIFFPISNILNRNSPQAIPDQILEKILLILRALCEYWWWECDVQIWQQIFILCGSIFGGSGGNGKSRQRDDETKTAAILCLVALLRLRTNDVKDTFSFYSEEESEIRFSQLQQHVQNSRFIPILGQTIDSLIAVTQTSDMALLHSSLQLLQIITTSYVSDALAPSILPGVVSSMSKVALGVSTGKGWSNGETVASALGVAEEIIVESIADDVCAREGAIRVANTLEDLAHLASDSTLDEDASHSTPSYGTRRTPSWLRATSSQLHIALKMLSPLTKHPNPVALTALISFSSRIIIATPTTLYQSQALLLSYLLSLSVADFPSVSSKAHAALTACLTAPSRAQESLLQTLLQITRDNLTMLPRALAAQNDAKVEHISGIITGVCRIGLSGGDGVTDIHTGIGRLVGPTGGIEKWGWGLLSVLELVEPPVTVTRTSSAQLSLESDPDALSDFVPFPEAVLRNVASRNVQDTLENMLRVLGAAAGDSCLFSVEWFFRVGAKSEDKTSVAAIWCACRVLEGVSGISHVQDPRAVASLQRSSKRLNKLARALTSQIAELWDTQHVADTSQDQTVHDAPIPDNVERLQGLVPLDANLKITRYEPVRHPSFDQSQPILHQALLLQLLAVTSGILQARFVPTLIYTLYPVLHSLVSPVMHLSTTALAALNFITTATSHASPANLLLSNFDYALDSVSRRLTRRWLDLDATKVLVVLVRIVGADVVDRAGDIVEECFDRLDDFHGYDVLVEGLIEALGAVVQVIKTESEADPQRSTKPKERVTDQGQLNSFFEWFHHRHDPDPDMPIEEKQEDFGPVPQEAWGREDDAPEADGDAMGSYNVLDEPTPTPAQALTKQIVTRSLYFLTHGSPSIRARILTLLASSVTILPESALLPSIHFAWPFIQNRLSDSETFVVSAVAELIEALTEHMGEFMFRRVWDDMWPKFKALLSKLDAADATSALAKRYHNGVGTESAYTHSHRLYRALLNTMTATMRGVQPQDSSVWEVLLSFRRFLDRNAHEELQACARALYVAASIENADAVWLVLGATAGDITDGITSFLYQPKWDISANTAIIMGLVDGPP